MRIETIYDIKKLFQITGAAFFLLLLSFTLQANYYFEESANFKRAYLETTALNLEKSKAQIEIGKRLEPENLLFVLLENYHDFLQLFVIENEADFHFLKNQKDKRIAQVLKGPKDSPYYLYTQAEINIQWAFARVKFREYWNAAWELRRAYRLLEQNIEKYPDFKPNYKSHSLIRVIAGSIPQNYHWIVNLFGISTNYESGVQTLRELVNNESQESLLFYEECLLILCMINSMLEMQPGTALNTLQERGYPAANRTLTYFTGIHIALHNRKNELATKWLDSLKTFYDFRQFSMLFYLEGLSALQNLDHSSVKQFKQFIQYQKSKHQVKQAYQKIAWAHWLQNDTAAYFAAMENVLTKGVADTDGDKQALAEAKAGQLPHREMLKARLLMDGGFYAEAANILNDIPQTSFTDQKQPIEFLYRKARVYHFMEKYEKAVTYYKQTIKAGRDEPFYYAANAALQLGFIYEEKSDFAQAADYYELCFTFENHAYKQSIDQRAKAGLKRVRN